MEEALIALLLSTAPVSALVGNRINWNKLPQGTVKPSVSMSVVSTTPSYTMAGQDGLVPTRVQIDVWGLTFSSVVAVSRAIKDKLSGFSGAQGAVSFSGIFLLSERQSTESTGTEVLHRVSLDFDVWHSAT